MADLKRIGKYASMSKYDKSDIYIEFIEFIEPVQNASASDKATRERSATNFRRVAPFCH